MPLRGLRGQRTTPRLVERHQGRSITTKGADQLDVLCECGWTWGCKVKASGPDRGTLGRHVHQLHRQAEVRRAVALAWADTLQLALQGVLDAVDEGYGPAVHQAAEDARALLQHRAGVASLPVPSR